ncbi:MAG: tagaturonate epimerase family protein, partial [Limisphaerales bacterium]
SSIAEFVNRHGKLAGEIRIPGVEKPFRMEKTEFERIVAKYLLAVQEAGRIYRYIAERKGADRFITEISMDETDAPQTPPELLIILAAIADTGVPVQTIAPKFTGRFNKGVDYVGDVRQFEQEFSDDVAVIAHSVKEYGLPKSLKLSVHSGSDKFSIYAAIRRVLRNSGAGLHIKTAGTTWLEEVIGLAEGGGEGLEIAKEIYAESLEHLEELCAPYATVIDIREERLPSAAEVQQWTSAQFTAALRHDQANGGFNPHLRQLIHVGYKVAAKKGTRYLGALKTFEESVSKNVTENLFERHIRPLFL